MSDTGQQEVRAAGTGGRDRARTPGPAVWPGGPEPLGASVGVGPDGREGTNFALWAGGAEAVELCLFDDAGRETRHPLLERTRQVWHGFVPGVGPGQRYGYRVHGRWDPFAGARWNPAKLLLDPYAQAVDGEFRVPAEVHGHVRDWPGREVADTVRDDRDSAPHVPKGVVVDDRFDWSADRRPATPWAETVIYELHVRGFTMRHPQVPRELRGTFAGLAHPAVIEHLTDLGVTAVELLPVQQFVADGHLVARGLTNYWGYSTVGYFAPHAGYASAGTRGQQVREFKEMVRALHAAGIEVLLDVVYNHTAEGNERGPTLFLRGIDNRAYYRTQHDPRRYADTTGCGNTVDAGQPPALRLITDSLRHWVTEMGVDGFRFDLAAALARGGRHGGDEVDMRAPFLAAIWQDPVLRRVKLVAEPWDVGSGGYQVGAFPAPWSEWNDRYRDAARDFLRGAHQDLREIGYRLSGSSDLYAHDGRSPCASVNFVTCHDGFTLRDLVSYRSKHNEANGEDNRDGADDNRSWNCGHEGETADPLVNALRHRQARNLMGALLVSTGVPMVTAGDEMGRTQGGNNNAYCHDDATSWVDWSLRDQPAWRALHQLTSRLVRLRRRHPVLRRAAFFTGHPRRPGGPPDLTWFTPAGRRMTEADWYQPAATVGMFLCGRDLPERDPLGQPISDDSFLLVWHTGPRPVRFTLPGPPWATHYEVEVDTAPEDQSAPPRTRHRAADRLRVGARALVLLRAWSENAPGGC
ncbi:glycogen debranching protein [Wenjunlia vitaminophila]|uniref:Glycogen debranching protein n=1 Tax=Wenjunlia vitaminophila TaxID=76728 RepID=A0A0T6LTN0_WENVI|nr:glycogen debranching protein GlgX [Wenjunlia vitaminophila]KRV49413.1 glycogen debranching protein [Wenjunlia vitaminophila]